MPLRSRLASMRAHRQSVEFIACVCICVSVDNTPKIVYIYSQLREIEKKGETILPPHPNSAT